MQAAHANTARVVLTLFLWLAPSGCGTGDETPDAGFGPGHAFTRLIAETTMLSPGETCTLGVAFDIEPGWHLFWNGTNDTGYPISVSLDLPPRLPRGRAPVARSPAPCLGGEYPRPHLLRPGHPASPRPRPR